MYSLTFADEAVTTAIDFFQIEPVTSAVCLHACYISQTLDVGDAAAENLVIQIRRVTDALTDADAAAPLDIDTPAETSDTVITATALATSPTLLHAEAWNIALPWVWLPPPELRIWGEIGNVLTVGFKSAPADSLTMSGTLYFEEVGG
jgi:hypothetical protein